MDPEYSIAEILTSIFGRGKSISDIDFRAKYGVNIVAIREENGINFNPAPNFVLQEESVLILVGSLQEIRSIEGKIK